MRITRKPIAVSVTGVENTINTQCNWVTTVVCDDGSVWQLSNTEIEWHPLPPIPTITLDP